MKFILSLLSFIPFLLSAQLQGYVVDASTRQPMENVVVLSKNDTTTTNKAGNFSINLRSDSLIFKRIGYQDKVLINPPKNKLLIVVLNVKIETLPELNISITPFNDPLKSSSGSTHMLSIKPEDKQHYFSSLDLLNQVPGVFVHQGTFNTNRITIRGIGSRTPYATNRIKAYFGDIPLTSGDGVSMIEDLDLNGMGRIELIKGPASAVYGSGLGGVIRFLSSPVEKNGISLQSSFGSFNTYRQIAGANYKQGRFNSSLNFSSINSDGFRENNRYKRQNIFFNTSYHTTNWHISLNLIYTKLNAQIPSSLSYTDFFNHPEKAAANWLAVKGYENYNKLLGSITATTFSKGGWTKKISLYSGTFKQYESRPFDILNDDLVFGGLRGSLKYDTRKFKVLLGIESYTEKYNYKLYFTNDGVQDGLKNANREARNYSNFFTYLSYNISKDFKIDGGINFNMLAYKVFDLYNDNVDISGNYSFKPILSPRLGLSYTALKNISFHTSAGHGFSHPSPEETLLPEGTINPDLKPEQGYNFETGIRWHLNPASTHMALTFYKMYLNNLLVTKRETEDIFYAINAGKTEHQGIEFTLFQTLLKQEDVWQINYTGSATFSDNYFTDYTSEGISYQGNTLPGIPSFNVNNQISAYFKNRFKLTTDWYFSGSQYVNDLNTEKSDGYSILNTHISFVLRQKKRYEITIFGHVNNILNARYASMILVNAPSFNGNDPRYFYPGQPRNLQMGLRLIL